MSAPVDSIQLTAPPGLTGTPKSDKTPAASATQRRIHPLNCTRCQEFEEIFLRMILKEAHLERTLANAGR